MEPKLVVVDDKDNIVGEAYKEEIEERKWNYRAVHIFIFNSEGELLLGKRPEHISFGGTWTASAGGKVDAGESYEEAAHRELKEELGVEMELEERFSFVFEDPDGYKVFHKVFKGEKESGFKPDKEEIAELKWIDIEFLKEDINENLEKYTAPFVQAFSSFLMNT